jgi:hypothetical protein
VNTSTGNLLPHLVCDSKEENFFNFVRVTDLKFQAAGLDLLPSIRYPCRKECDYAVVSEGFIMKLREFTIGRDTFGSHNPCSVELGSIRPKPNERKYVQTVFKYTYIDIVKDHLRFQFVEL